MKTTETSPTAATATGDDMRERDRNDEHEAAGARELDRVHSPNVERIAAEAEQRIRAEGGNLADMRSAWAEFESKQAGRVGDQIQRDFVEANRLAYARAVDDGLKRETGQGLQERHPPAVDDFDELMAGLPSRTPAAPGPERQAPERIEHHTNVGRSTPAPGPERPLQPEERAVVQAEAQERIERPAEPRERPENVRPEDWYSARAQQLPAPARASVDREVNRLKDIPQLGTREQAEVALAAAAREFEAARAAGQEVAQLRTRVYALALVHDLRRNDPPEAPRTNVERLTPAPGPERPAPERIEHRTNVERLAPAPGPERPASAPRVAPVPERDIENEPTRDLPMMRSSDFRSIERETTLDRDITAPDIRAMLEMSDEFRSLGDDLHDQTIAERMTTGEGDMLARRIAERLQPELEVTRPDVTNDRRSMPAPTVELPRQDITNPGRRNIPVREQETPTPRDADATNPGRRIPSLQVPLAERETVKREVPERTIEINTRDLDLDEVRNEATINTRLSDRYRDAAAREQRMAASIAADADRELFTIRGMAHEEPYAAELVRGVDAYVAELRADMRNLDPYDLSKKIADLQMRERIEPEVTDGRLRTERLAYGVLAREAFERQNGLLGSMTRDRVNELRAMPVDERKELATEAVILLQHPAYNDRFAMNRELARAESDRVAQVAALSRLAPSPKELERQATERSRDPAFNARVERRVQALLLTPERDAALVVALADARVRATFAGHIEQDAVSAQLALEEAVELDEVLRRLPVSRSLDIDTAESRFRIN